MRLICPNCDAQYEVDDSVIPSGGRDVQCSNCGQTWFQGPAQPIGATQDAAAYAAPDLPPEKEEQTEDAQPEPFSDTDADDTPHPEPTGQDFRDQKPAQRERRALDDAVLGILKEEANRETQARRSEDTTGLESQPDLGLQDRELTTEPLSRIQERTARLRGIEPEDVSDGSATSRSDLLPDIEEINSTLRASSDRKDKSRPQEVEVDPERVKTRRRGFRLGFGLVLLAVVAVVFAYLYAPQIVKSVPQSEALMSRYVVSVNNGRDRLDMLMQQAIQKLQENAGDASQN